MMLQLGLDGLPQIAAQLVGIVGALVLVLLLVALGAFVYRSVQGDGITWPSDEQGPAVEEEGGVSRGGDDDEWKFY